MLSGIRRRIKVTPQRFTALAFTSLALLTLIVATGAGVRLTASGLGCQTWPNCVAGQVTVPADLHSLIEFGNRALSGLISIFVLITAVASLLRQPFRRDLAILAWTLPLGVFVQAALGALSVKSELAWEWVSAHFIVSMVIQVFAILLAWRSLHAPGERPRSGDRLAVWSIRVLPVLTALVLISGVGVTASGPHAGGYAGQTVSPRFAPKPSGSLEWVLARHGRAADLLGIAAIAVWLLLWRRRASRELRVNSTVFVVLVGIQGLIGSIQWHNQLPAELVWLHVLFALFCWSSALWFCMAAGRLRPRTDTAAASASYANRPANAS